MSNLNDGLQVSAGICGAVGFVLLSTGVFSNSDDPSKSDESSVKYIRPVLTGIGFAILVGELGHYIPDIGKYFSFPGISDWLTASGMQAIYTSMGIFIGFLLGYAAGFPLQRFGQRNPDRVRRIQWYLVLFLVLLLALGALSAVEAAYFRPITSVFPIGQVITAITGLAFGYILVMFSTWASPRSLKILGFFVTLLGIYLAVLPSLLSLLGASGQ